MRILVIWGESLGKPGSGTAHCLGLCKGLVACGHELRIITPHYAGQTLHTDGLDVRPVALPARGWISFLCFQMLSVVILPLWLLRHRPHAVYVRTCFLQGVMALICRTAGIPLVGEVDSMVDEEIRMRGQPDWAAALTLGLDRFNNRLSSGLVCVSRGLRDESIRRCANPATTVAIPNGARTDLMQPSDRTACRDQFGLAERDFVVGFAGTLAAWQGLDFLVAAAAKLPHDPGLTLAIMGAGQFGDELRRQVAAAGLDELFVFVPPGSQEQVARFLGGCDAVVVPINDPRRLRYGLSVLKFWDAVSVGLPVVAPEGSELEEPLADLGLPGLFDPTDPSSLAAALLAVAQDGPLPLQRRMEVHEQVRQRYSWDAVAQAVGRFLQTLLPKGARS